MRKEALIPILFFLSILVIWQVSVSTLEVKKYLLPGPLDIAEKISDKHNILIKHTLVTLSEASAGFAIGAIFALAIALVITNFRIAGLMLFPIIILVHTTPKIAIAPFLTIWFGFGLAPKIAVAAIVVFFPIVINAVRGLSSIDIEMLDLMKSYGANKIEMLLKVGFPSALPFILTSFRIAAAGSIIGAVVGEFTGADSGLGYLILLANTNFDTSLMFASLALLASMGMGFFYLAVWVEKRVLYWQKGRSIIYLNNN